MVTAPDTCTPPQGHSTPHRSPRRRRPKLLTPLSFTTILLSALFAPSSAISSFASPNSIHHSRGLHPKTPPAGPECNPFAAPGWLEVDLDVPINNRWIPFAGACASSSLMSSLYIKETDDGPLIPVQGGAPHIASSSRGFKIGR